MTITVSLLLVLACASAAILRGRTERERTLVLGTTGLAWKIVAEIIARPRGRYVLAGVVEDRGDAPPPFPVAALIAGRLDELDAVIERVRPERIVIALADRRGRLPLLQLLEARLNGIAVEDGVQFYERLTGKIAIETLTPDALIRASGFHGHRLDVAVGRALGRVLAAAALMVLAPLFAAVALAIKLDSRGPVLFAHERVGLHGRRLRLLKFRTMHPAAQITSEWSGDNGARITRLGRWLRRYHIDELPQLVNVLRDEMSLVGPRPHPVRNFDLFTEKIPYYRLRALVRPGLTGWAQVRQGYANGLDEEIEKMRYDLYYIKHMSASLDLAILFRTVQIVLWGHHLVADPSVQVPGTALPATGPAPALIASVSTLEPQ